MLILLLTLSSACQCYCCAILRRCQSLARHRQHLHVPTQRRISAGTVGGIPLFLCCFEAMSMTLNIVDNIIHLLYEWPRRIFAEFFVNILMLSLSAVSRHCVREKRNLLGVLVPLYYSCGCWLGSVLIRVPYSAPC